MVLNLLMLVAFTNHNVFSVYAKYKMLVSILPNISGWLIVVNYRVNA